MHGKTDHGNGTNQVKRQRAEGRSNGGSLSVVSCPLSVVGEREASGRVSCSVVVLWHICARLCLRSLAAAFTTGACRRLAAAMPGRRFTCGNGALAMKHDRVRYSWRSGIWARFLPCKLKGRLWVCKEPDGGRSPDVAAMPWGEADCAQCRSSWPTHTWHQSEGGRNRNTCPPCGLPQGFVERQQWLTRQPGILNNTRIIGIDAWFNRQALPWLLLQAILTDTRTM